MADIIEIPLSGDPESVYQSAKKKAESNGIVMDGNARKGTFAGLGSKGSYEVMDKTVKISITKKPAMFPMAMIEAMVKKMFS